MNANPDIAVPGEQITASGTVESQHGTVTSEDALSRHDGDDRSIGKLALRNAPSRTASPTHLSFDSVSATATDEHLAFVNERLRADNEAFRASINTNVSLRSAVNRLENASRELETDIRSLEAEVAATRRRCDAQSLKLAELKRCIAGAEKSGRREQLQQQGEISRNDAEARIYHEQKVMDLTALIKQLQEDRKIKLQLLATREVQLSEKQALYTHLAKRQEGHDTAEPLEQMTLDRQHHHHKQNS